MGLAVRHRVFSNMPGPPTHIGRKKEIVGGSRHSLRAVGEEVRHSCPDPETSSQYEEGKEVGNLSTGLLMANALSRRI